VSCAADVLWNYVNAQRLFIFVEEAIDESVRWVVFETNSEPLGTGFRRSIHTAASAACASELAYRSIPATAVDVNPEGNQ
jgi:phage tail sheath protein FI